MCLAIPGKLLDAEEIGGLRIGRVQFGGITRKAYLDFVPEANVGDYVIVHVGIAISKVDEEQARATYALLEKTGLLAEEGLAGDDGEEGLATLSQAATTATATVRTPARRVDSAACPDFSGGDGDEIH